MEKGMGNRWIIVLSAIGAASSAFITAYEFLTSKSIFAGRSGILKYAQPATLLAVFVVVLCVSIIRDTGPHKSISGAIRIFGRRVLATLLASLGGRRYYEARFVLGVSRPVGQPRWLITEVRFATLESLIQRNAQIRKYFEDRPSASQLRVKIIVGEGYLLDRFLLWGIIDNFDQAWADIVQHHHVRMDQIAAEQGSIYKSRLPFAHFRRSQLTTWLMWGPSIPSCNCALWTKRKNRDTTNSAGVKIAWQFGFADESNSVFLCLDGAEYPLSSSNGAVTRITGSRLIVNNPRHSMVAEKVNLLAATQDIREKQDGRIFLTLSPEHSKLAIANDDNPHRYYTAYTWLMFICLIVPVDKNQPIRLYSESDLEGETIPVGDLPINHACLLPFFIHCNIFDPRTREAREQMLVSLALSSISSLLNFENMQNEPATAPDSELIFVYAGAVDDSLHYAVDIKNGQQGQRQRIKKLLETQLENHAVLKAKVWTIERLLQLDNLRRPNRKFIQDLRDKASPCKFSSIFEPYYAEIRDTHERDAL